MHRSTASGAVHVSSMTSSGVKSILKLYLSKSIVTDGKTTRSKVEKVLTKKRT